MPPHPLSPSEFVALSQAAPRYTSYPSVPQWSIEPPKDALERAFQGLREPLAVYVHVPFCWDRCFYCGCNMVVSRRQSAGDRFLRAIQRQIEALPLTDDTRTLRRLHLGGGTPTWLSPHQLDTLLTTLLAHFRLQTGAECSVEVHPGVTDNAHLDVLAAHGFRRLSIGVQSTSDTVLVAIGRKQTTQQIEDLTSAARRRGFDGINIDLVYGLPSQTDATFGETLSFVETLRPDRIALYGYAHLPWLRHNQAKIDEKTLPSEETRAQMFMDATARLRRAGYQTLGLDHFALPSDPLAKAASRGELSRDFMGHTDRVTPLLGLGPSGISELGGWYLQQQPALGSWYRSVEGGHTFPVARSHQLTADDALRRDAIRTLMSQLKLSWFPLTSRHGQPAQTALADAIDRLQPWARLDAIQWTPNGLKVTEKGRLLLKNLASCFDPSTSGAPPAWRTAPSSS